MPNVVDHVRALLSEPPKVSHEGRLLHVIPGPECRMCKGTGHVRVHGMPSGRFGPRLDTGCHSCGRDPEKWLHKVIEAKLIVAAIKQDPSLLNLT